MKTFKETGITFIIMLTVTVLVLTFGLKDYSAVDYGELNETEVEYCNSAFKKLPYDEFVRETRANNIECYQLYINK